MAEILDGKALAGAVREGIKKEVANIISDGGPPPGLAVVLVGDNPASRVYVNAKKEACSDAGIYSLEVHLESDVSESELIDVLQGLNRNELVHGILLQLPLPSHINSQRALETIIPSKDVDGFHPENVGRLVTQQDGFVPCTPLGAMALMRHHGIMFRGKNVLVIGRSNIVGKPMAMLLLHEHATVTIAHSRTVDLPELARHADILVAAIGRAGFVKGDWIKEGAVVIDVGINSVSDLTAKKGYRLKGDVEFEEASKRAAFITPVPGGIGPMTIAMLLQNTLKARKTLVGNPRILIESSETISSDRASGTNFRRSFSSSSRSSSGNS